MAVCQTWRELLYPRTGNDDRWNVLGGRVHSFPGDSGPLHFHKKEDQYVVVLEGTVRIVLGEKTIDAVPGQSLAMMRGIPHGLGNATQERVRFLSISVPGGAEEALVIISNNPNMDHAGLLELAARFDVTMVGPPIIDQLPT
jgi:quercetin dioxygenase-like cupin family protein